MTAKIAVNDRSAICIAFILRHLEAHRRVSTRPFFIGLNGIQGAGKTTLVRSTIQYFSASGEPDCHKGQRVI